MKLHCALSVRTDTSSKKTDHVKVSNQDNYSLINDFFHFYTGCFVLHCTRCSDDGLTCFECAEGFKPSSDANICEPQILSTRLSDGGIIG